MSYEWVGAAIQVLGPMLGQYFQQKDQKSVADAQLAFKEKELAQQLEIEKLRLAKGGGGGGRSRDLDLLEMALGIYGDDATRRSQAFSNAGNRYTQIYASLGK